MIRLLLLASLGIDAARIARLTQAGAVVKQ